MKKYIASVTFLPCFRFPVHCVILTFKVDVQLLQVSEREFHLFIHSYSFNEP